MLFSMMKTCHKTTLKVLGWEKYYFVFQTHAFPGLPCIFCSFEDFMCQRYPKIGPPIISYNEYSHQNCINFIKSHHPQSAEWSEKDEDIYTLPLSAVRPHIAC